jgi:hypothetical protein
VTAAAFMAAQSAVITDELRWRQLNLSAGYLYDQRVNKLGESSAVVLAGIQGNARYLKALTDSGQLANFQSLAPG